MKKTMQHLLKTMLSTLFILFATTVVAQDTEVFVQMGHTSLVSSVDISPDGKYAISGSLDDTIKLWEIATGREVRTFAGHQAPVNDVAFSPDGRYVISGSTDRTIKLWEVSTGRELRTFRGHKRVSSVAFSPDGQYVLSGSWDNIMKLWEVSTGRQIRTFSGHTEEVNSEVTFSDHRYGVGFSPDGKYVVSGSLGRTIRIWEVSTGREVHTFNHTENVEIVGVSPTGHYVLSGGDNGSLKLWELTTGRQVRSFSGRDNVSTRSPILGVDFSPDGKYAVSGSADRTIRIWEVSTGREIRTITGYDEISDVVFSPDGRYILAGSWDKRLYLFDASTGREIRAFSGHSISSSRVAYSPDGQYLLSGASRALRLWDASTAREARAIKMENNYSLNSISFSSDGRHLLTGGFDLLKLWDVSTGRELKNFVEPRSGYSFNSVALSPDGLYILTGGRKQIPRKIVDGKYVGGELISELKLWDIATGKEVRTIEERSSGAIHSVDYSPDGRYVLSSSSDRQENYLINLWEVSTGRKVQTFRGHKEYVTNVVFSPDGQRFVSSSADNTLKLWNVSTGQEIRTFKGHRSSVQEVTFSPDGRFILSGGWDKTLKLWEVSTGRVMQTFSGHIGWIDSIDLSPDGKFAISASKDGTIRIWDVKTGKEVAQIVTFDNDEWVVVTPEGYYNASANGAQFLNVRIGNEVYPIDNFFDTYYRPDIVRAKLAGKDISAMIETNIHDISELPPSVRFTSPVNHFTSSAPQFTLTTEITDQGGGIDEVRLFHNGKLISGGTRGLKLAVGSGTDTITREFEVSLLTGANVFRLSAFSIGQRIESNPAELIVQYNGAVATADLYVLAVGLNEYKNATLNLNYGRPDAEAFVEAVRSQSAGIFKSVNVKTLYDGQATRINLLAAFEDIITKAKPQDAFLLFYAGHGVMSEPEGQKQGDFYMVLHETIRLYGDNAGLAVHGISAAEMTELTRRIAARKQMIVLDACQSGGAVQTFAMRGAAEQKAILQLARSAGLVVLASTGTEQYATEFQALGHGVFTYALLNGLSGKADGGSRDGKITVKELEAFINDRVPALTRKHRGQAQYPNSYARGQDFPLTIVDE